MSRRSNSLILYPITHFLQAPPQLEARPLVAVSVRGAIATEDLSTPIPSASTQRPGRVSLPVMTGEVGMLYSSPIQSSGRLSLAGTDNWYMLFPTKTFDQSAKSLHQSASNHPAEYLLSSTRRLLNATETPACSFGKVSIYGAAEPFHRPECGTCHTFCRANSGKNRRQFKFQKIHHQKLQLANWQFGFVSCYRAFRLVFRGSQ